MRLKTSYSIFYRLEISFFLIACKISFAAGWLGKLELNAPVVYPSNLMQITSSSEAPPPQQLFLQRSSRITSNLVLTSMLALVLLSTHVLFPTGHLQTSYIHSMSGGCNQFPFSPLNAQFPLQTKLQPSASAHYYM